jgi:hypothetical protein
MKKSSMKLAGSVLIGVAGLSLPAWAQNEALRTCRAEWRANQAGLRANGITQKVYVADCQTAATKLGIATTGRSADPPGKAALKAQKTVKTCQREWFLNRIALRANGITQKVFVSDCQAAAAKVGTSAAAPVAADSPAKPAAAPNSPTPDAASGKIKACQEEWRTKRTADEVPGITEKAYVEQCRGGDTTSGKATPSAVSAPTTPR